MARRRNGKARWLTWDRIVGGGWLVGLTALSVIGLLPFWVVLWYALLSLCAFAAYATDKAQAAAKRRRVPERGLHLLALAGGWPGALLAQQQFRHKTRKARFQVLFWGTVLAHVIGLVWYIT